MAIALHVCISGFTQGPGREGVGVFRLSEALIAQGHGADVRRRVWFLRWCEDWRRWAQHVELISLLHGERVEVACYAYSWGAGWGAMQFARQLRRLGIAVRFMVLSDPVYRSRWLSFRWRSLMRRDVPIIGAPSIRVPQNVGRVVSFYQTINRPQAHRLIADDATEIVPPVKLWRAHEAMDHAPEFHAAALDAADALAAAADLAPPPRKAA